MFPDFRSNFTDLELLNDKYFINMSLQQPVEFPMFSKEFKKESLILYNDCIPSWKTLSNEMQIINIELPYNYDDDYKYFPFCYLKLSSLTSSPKPLYLPIFYLVPKSNPNKISK